MHYLEWTEGEIQGLGRGTGIAVLLTEVHPDGTVHREIGLDERGEVVHVFPSEQDARGLFDLAVVDLGDSRDDLTAEEFQGHWERWSG